MGKVTVIALIGIMIVVLIAGLGLPLSCSLTIPMAHAADKTLVDFYRTGDNGNQSVYADYYSAQTFTTSTSYTLQEIRLKLYRVGSPGYLYIELRATSGGEPTEATLSTGSYNANGLTDETEGAWSYPITMTEYHLEASTQYAIVIFAPSGYLDDAGNNTLSWRYDSTGTLANGNKLTSSNGGVTWSADSGHDFLFETWGKSDLLINSVQVWSSFIEEGDWLITAYYTNNVAPESPDESPARYWNLQLVHSGNSTFYPDAHVEDTTVDGWILQHYATGSGVDWATIRGASGTGYSDILTTMGVRLESDNVENQWQNLERMIFLFDTSTIPDEDTITSATLSLYGSSKGDQFSFGDNHNINIYTSSPASDTEFENGDFDSLGSTNLCDTAITYANWGTSGFNDFVLNSTGIAQISKTGITKLGARNQYYDVLGNTPGWQNNLTSALNAWTADEDQSGDRRPKLIVSYNDILAQSPIRYWGYRVGSIYLSADEVTSLDWGSGDYIVRLHSSTSSVDYNLTAADWRGMNQSELDAWCIQTAKAMGREDNQTYTMTVAEKGEVINSTAGPLFQTGIPGIACVRQADLFQEYKCEYERSDYEFADELQAETDMEARLGPYIYGAIDTASTTFGIETYIIGFLVIVAIYMMMATAVPAGHALAGAILSLGILYIGLYIGAFLYLWYALAGMVAIGLFIWHFVVRSA